MFHVVANVPRDVVPWAVVRIRLIALLKNVVLCDKMGAKGVESHGQERAHHEVIHSLEAGKVTQANVKDYLNDDIDNFHIHWGLGMDDKGSQCIEDWLEDHPNHLAEGIAEKLSLPLGGQICINAVDAQIPVMLQVVLFEGDRHREDDRQVRPDAKETVSSRIAVAEDEVVGDLVNGQH